MDRKKKPLVAKKPERMNVAVSLAKREVGAILRVSGAGRFIQWLAEEKLIEKNHEEFPCILPEGTRSTFLMVFSADGTMIASTHGNHNVYVTDLRSGRNIKTLSGHPRTPWCIAFHPSSNQILASGCLGGQVRVWDLHGGSEIWMAESSTVISSLAFHPTDRILVIASYNEIHFWDWSHEKPFAKCSTANEREKVRYVAFDQLGHKLVTGISNAPRIQSQWDRVSAPQPPPQESQSEHERRITICYRYMVEQYEQLVERYIQLSNVAPGLNSYLQRTPPQTMDRGTDPMDSPPTSQTNTRCNLCRGSLVDRSNGEGSSGSESASSASSSTSASRESPSRRPTATGTNEISASLSSSQFMCVPSSSSSPTAGPSIPRITSVSNSHSSRCANDCRDLTTTRILFERLNRLRAQVSSFTLYSSLNRSDRSTGCNRISGGGDAPCVVGPPPPSGPSVVSTDLESESNSEPNESNSSDSNSGRPTGHGSFESSSAIARLRAQFRRLQSAYTNRDREPHLLRVAAENAERRLITRLTTFERRPSQNPSSLPSVPSDLWRPPSVSNLSSIRFGLRLLTDHIINMARQYRTTSESPRLVHILRLWLEVFTHIGCLQCIVRLSNVSGPDTGSNDQASSSCDESESVGSSSIRVVRVNPLTTRASEETSGPASSAGTTTTTDDDSDTPDGGGGGGGGGGTSSTVFKPVRRNHYQPPPPSSSSPSSRPSTSSSIDPPPPRPSTSSAASSPPPPPARRFRVTPRVQRSHWKRLRCDFTDRWQRFGSRIMNNRETTPADAGTASGQPTVDSNDEDDEDDDNSPVAGRSDNLGRELKRKYRFRPPVSAINSRLELTSLTMRARSLAMRLLRPRLTCGMRFPRLDARGSTGQNVGETSEPSTSRSSSNRETLIWRARHVLLLMVDSLMQFFENDTFTGRDTSDVNLSERVSNLVSLLELASNLTHLLLRQLDSPTSLNFRRDAFVDNPSVLEELREFIAVLQRPVLQRTQRDLALRRRSSFVDVAYPRRGLRSYNAAASSSSGGGETATNEGTSSSFSSTNTTSSNRLNLPVLMVNDNPVPPEQQSSTPTSSSSSTTSSAHLPEMPWAMPTSVRSMMSRMGPVMPPNRRPIGASRVRYFRPFDNFEGRARFMPLRTMEVDSALNSSEDSLPERGGYIYLRDPSLHNNGSVQSMFMETPMAPHHRIQVWDFTKYEMPEINNPEKNVVVSECKIHNDASVDISTDGNIIVTLLPSGRLSITTMLGVYSLHWETLGQCLYTTSFDQNAVSVSLSPTNRHLVVSLASRRLNFVNSDRQTVAQIFRLEGGSAGKYDLPVKGKLVLVRDIEMSREPADFMSLNCIRWAPCPGEGFVYATNSGKLKILR